MHKMCILTVCVHYTLYTCARFHLTGQLITKNTINTLTTAHQKQVLSQQDVNTVFYLTSISGYINTEICDCITRHGENYMMEQRGFVLECAAKHFFVYLFLRFACVCYGRFVAVHCGFNLSTYVHNRW
jgi:hypothetical protein